MKTSARPVLREEWHWGRRWLRRLIRLGLRWSPLELPRHGFRRLAFSSYASSLSPLFRGRETVDFLGVRVTVDPGDKLGYFTYFLPQDVAWEIEELAFWSQQSPLVADVGANAGLVSLVLAHRCPGVIVVAFEPEPSALAAFRGNLKANPGLEERVQLVEQAVSGVDGEVSFHPPSQTNSGNGKVGTSSSHTFTVPSVRLDTFFRGHPAPHVIKIDVEGAELDVLRGATETLSRARVVLVELHGDTRPDIGDFNLRVAKKLRSAGFDLYSLKRNGRTRLGDPLQLRPRMHLLGLRADARAAGAARQCLE